MKAKNVRSFELKLGKRALFFFVLGISCLLFVVFLLGVRVGKIMDAYPEKVAGGIPRLVMEYFGWTQKKAETGVAASEVPIEPAVKGDGKAELTFFDTLGKKEKEAKTAGQGTSGSNPEAVRENSARGDNTVPTAQPPAKPAEKPPASAVKGKYHVQVVSLKEREKAEQLCKKLNRLGYSPRITATELQNKGKWFRVVLDGFDSQEQAQKATNDVSKKISGVNCVIKKSD
jgi:cell division septation protein DedD